MSCHLTWTTPEAHAVIRGWLRDVLRDAETTTFLYDEDGSLLGYAITRVGSYEDNAYVYGRSWVHVDQLGVTRAARRKGVGRALMDAVQAHADALDVDAVQLDVRAFNDGARAFYEALGYAPSKIAMRRSRR